MRPGSSMTHLFKDICRKIKKKQTNKEIDNKLTNIFTRLCTFDPNRPKIHQNPFIT